MSPSAKTLRMNPVKSIRFRYILGLSALAVLISGTYFLLDQTIDRQKDHGRVIEMAGNQTGLSNRIAFFVGQMSASTSDEEFDTARQQVGRAIQRMRTQHRMLLGGDPESGLPRIMTPLLETIYFDHDFGLDIALDRFLKNAGRVYETGFGSLSTNDAAYVYVTTVGPHVLETILNAAVTEYDEFSRAEINKLKQLELLALAAALALLLIEAMFIFRPLERRVRGAFQEIRAKRDELTLERDRAEQANRSKIDFLAHMSHELRTPLNAIIGLSECLKLGVYGRLETGGQTDCVEDIHRSGLHLYGLVNDILDISAGESDGLQLNEAVLTLDELISASVTYLGPIPERAGVLLDIDLSGPMLKVRADERRVRQILINLLTNAVKYTPKGGRVKIGKILTEDGRAGFAVRDNGIGMTEREIAVAAERFGRVGSVLTHRHDGAGLGLPVAIELMKSHGGTLEIASEKGRGTTVTTLFPAERVSEDAQLDLVLPRAERGRCAADAV